MQRRAIRKEIAKKPIKNRAVESCGEPDLRHGERLLVRIPPIYTRKLHV